jgi:O-antigen ligase
VYLHADTERHARQLLVAVLVGAAAEAAYSLGAFALGLDYYSTYGYNRASGTFSTWNHLGGFMALTSIPTLAYALYARRPVVRWLLLLAFAAEIVTLLLTLTLGSILGLAVGGFFAAVFMFRIPLQRIAAGVAVSGIAFLAAFLFNPLLQEKLGRIGERVVDRLITYTVGVSMLEDRFWFGFGSQARVVEALFLPLRGYTLTPFGESGVVPHASVLSMGVEKGIFGAVFFLLIIVGAIRVLLRQRARYSGTSQNLLFQGMVVGLLAFIVQDLTNNLLLHARLGILFFSLLAVAAALGRHLLAERDPDPAP